MRTKPKRVTLRVYHPREKIPLQIVADAGIATTSMSDGRMIPLAILDTSKRPDLEEFIEQHQFSGPGDVDCQWATSLERNDCLQLFLKFRRPMELVAFIEFDLNMGHALLIQAILESRALYLQAGRPGDRLKDDLGRPKVIIEVPDTGIGRAWEEILRRHTVRQARAAGLDRAAAKRAAQSYIRNLREMGQLTLPPE